MTEEQIKAYKDYWKTKSEKYKDYLTSWKHIGLATREMLNDNYVVSSDMVEICELALYQIYDNETKKILTVKRNKR